MGIVLVLLMLVLASTIEGRLPTYPRDFEVRGCSAIEGRDPGRPDVACRSCTWIRTDDGWMVSCQ